MFRTLLATMAIICSLCFPTAKGDTVVFFDSSQVATPVASGVTSDTIRSHGYLFTYTRDKLFTGGIGPDPIGRDVRVPWPQGVEAQAVTTPPPGVTDHKARIDLARVDGQLFDLTAFSAQLLANTFGAGGSIEIMPLLDGEDAFGDPIFFNATGFYGQTFSYDTSPNYLGSTALLHGFDAYKITLYVDFALTALTLEGPPVPGPPGDYNEDYVVDARDYVVWRNNLGRAESLPNDSTAGVGTDDYLRWKGNYGQAAAASYASRSLAVPEPSTLVLGAWNAFALTALCYSRRG